MSLSPFSQGSYGTYNTYAYFQQASQQEEMRYEMQEQREDMERMTDKMSAVSEQGISEPVIESMIDSPVYAYSKPTTSDLFKTMMFLG